MIKLLLNIIIIFKSVSTISVNFKATTILGYEENFEGKKINTYLGIPYAIIPARFKHSLLLNELPYKKFNATKWPVQCPQVKSLSNILSSHNLINDENCLVLNIWIPRKAINSYGKKKTKIPAFIFIHGGGFLLGSSSQDKLYSGLYMSEESNSIVITFNYRIGVLGFMYGGNNDIPGNAGIVDQMNAIQWVYNNIKYFGGDNQHITIGGHSAGSISLSFLLFTHYANLFKNSILMSGAIKHGFNFYNKKEAFTLSKILADTLNCTHHNDHHNFSRETIDCLLKINYKQFLKYSFSQEFQSNGFFLPINDGKILPESFNEQTLIKKSATILLGNVPDEGFIAQEIMNRKYNFSNHINYKSINKQLKIISGHRLTHQQLDDLHNIYIISANISNGLETRYRVIYHDLFFKCPSLYLANLLAKFNNVYLYKFNYCPSDEDSDVFKSLLINEGECGHGFDVLYLFGYYNRFNGSQDDKAISSYFVKLLSKFIHNLTIDWPSVKITDNNYFLPIIFDIDLKANRLHKKIHIDPEYYRCIIIKNYPF